MPSTLPILNQTSQSSAIPKGHCNQPLPGVGSRKSLSTISSTLFRNRLPQYPGTSGPRPRLRSGPVEGGWTDKRTTGSPSHSSVGSGRTPWLENAWQRVLKKGSKWSMERIEVAVSRGRPGSRGSDRQLPSSSQFFCFRVKKSGRNRVM